jgi:iron complex transport system ATP-binding protein
VSEPPLLVARALHVRRGDKLVLDEFDFSADRGSVHALCGPNGAGKSTALKALAGLLPSEGTIDVLGRPLGRWSRRERAQRLAYVPQQSLLQSGICVREVVAQGRYAHDPVWPGRYQRQPAVERALLATDAGELADRRWNELSGGEQRRVLLARALATEAPIILLDEPTAALDVSHALKFLELLRGLTRQGRCIVVVLHDLEQVRRYADHALVLHHGRTLARGLTRDVIAPDVVRAAYGVELVPGGGLGYRLLDEGSP